MTAHWDSALDSVAFRALNADLGPALDWLALTLSAKGFGVASAVVLAATIALALRAGRVRLILALAGAIALSDGVGSQVLKPAFARKRPCYSLPAGEVRWLTPAADVGSLPSLHAANFFAMATVAAAADPRLGAAAFVVAAAVALSRVYVGVHWPTDVLAGALWGVAAGVVALAIATRILRRLVRRASLDVEDVR